MENSFKYVFVETKSSWFIGSSHSSLSFSSDGTTIAGTMAVNSPYCRNGRVYFWETATGAVISLINDWSSVVFSPTNPDMAIVVGSKGIQAVKRTSPRAEAWNVCGICKSYFTAPAIAVYRSGGKTTVQGFDSRLYEHDATSFQFLLRYTERYTVKASSVAYCPLDPELLIVGREDGHLEVISHTGQGTSQLHCQLKPVSFVKVSACAWSQDGRWIATGDDVGDIRLWNASVTTNISLARILPCDRSSPITSLIFLPDSTGLIILCGGYLTVWDIVQGVYVANSGLPAMAMNIALDGPRNRIAVAINGTIFLYELKLHQLNLHHQKLHQQKLHQQKLHQQKLNQQRLHQQKLHQQEHQQKLPGQQNPLHHNRQTKGKHSISSELAGFDITNKVVKSKRGHFVSLYFDIYRGVWNFDTPRIFQHVVAIKALRPGFNPRSKTQEREDFEDRLTKCLTTWAKLTHDNLLPLLGVSMNFGRFPAIVTSWMPNGLLSDYIKSEEEYDKMELIVGVARGIAYLHSEGVVHSDIRGSSFLVDELGNARLADPGLHSVFANSPLIVSGTMNVLYRWMAPELLKNSSAKATSATDVYSVTMTSLEIFTANDPFEGDSDALVASQVLNNQRPERPEDVGDMLWSLWNEGWNQDPAKRPDMASYVGHLNQLA